MCVAVRSVCGDIEMTRAQVKNANKLEQYLKVRAAACVQPQT